MAEPDLMAHFGAWYHGTRADLEPGGMIEPGHESSLAPYLREHGIVPTQQDDTADRTFFSSDAGQAARWARSRGDPRLPSAVYEVEPTGPHEEDPGGGEGDRRSHHPLRVVRKISLLEHFAAYHPGPHYHGTRAELEPGDLIEPGKYPKSYSPWGEEEAGIPRDHVYFSPHKNYITENYGPHVYEVEPTGDYSRDPEYSSSNRRRPMFRSKSPLRVVRRVSTDWGAREGLLAHFAAWFHGTEHEFAAGDMVTTPASRGAPVAMGRDPDYSYFTPYKEKAAIRGSRVFEVEPTGHYEPDPNAGHGMPFSKDPDAGAHRSQHPLRVIREAAAADEGLPNPYHGHPDFGGNPEFSHTWFHGTRGSDPHFGEQYQESGEKDRLSKPPDEREMHMGWPQPNKMLGVHLSPLHRVSWKFASGVYPSKKFGTPGTPAAIVHTRLHMNNPAHYPTEDHLNLAMAQYADKHYPGWHNDKLNSSMAWNYSDQKGTHRNWHEQTLPGGEPNQHGLSDDELAERKWGEEDPSHPQYFKRMAGHAQHILQWHPHLPEIIEGFKGHLESQGHHGITYGNEVEGPGDGRREDFEDEGFAHHTYQDVRHISAIATRPSQIETTRVEHIAPPQTEPQAHEVEHHPPSRPYWGGDEDFEHGRRGYASDLNEDAGMYRKIGEFHEKHGGEYPRPAHGLETAAAYVPKHHVSLGESARIVARTRKQGGMSVNMSNGREPHHGFMVAHKDGSHILDAHDFYGAKGPRILRDYIHAHHQSLRHPRAHLGTWHDQDSGKVFLDVAHNIKDQDTAIDDARKNDQIAIYDLDHDAEVPTGGTGGLEKAAAASCDLCGLEQTEISATMQHLRTRSRLRLASLAMPSEYDEDDTSPPQSEIHRGVSFETGHYHPETHRILHDESIPVAERAAHLMAHLGPRLEKDKWGGGGVGQHWSTSEKAARGFATPSQNPADQPWSGLPKDLQFTRVVFHAAPPKASHMITSPRTKMRHDILPTTHGEREVPLRNRAPVTLTGVSWSRHEWGKRDLPWTRHDFPQPIRVKASAEPAKDGLTPEQFAPLESRLLGKGGKRVVNPGYEPDLDKIMERGQDWDGGTAVTRRMRSRDCHANAARLHETQGHQIATGYALSEDGLWRQHSWGIHSRTGKPVETTTPRAAYHGVVLTSEEAADFARANPSHRQASRPAGPVYYHGTAHEYQPGDLVDPDRPSHYQPEPEGYAFFTADQKRARHYADSALAREPYTAGKDAHVYQVQPTGPHFSVDPRGGPQVNDRKSVYPLRVLRRVDASSSGDRHVQCARGHTHWGAYGAAGLLIRHKGDDGQQRYLLQKRSPYVNEPDTWSVPGGAIGRHESPEQGAWREAREEMGSIPSHVKTHHIVKSTDCGDWAYHTVVADAEEHFMPRGGGKTQHETAGVGWHTADEIEDLRDQGDLHPAFAKSWDAVRRSRGPKQAVLHPDTPDYAHGMQSGGSQVEWVRREKLTPYMEFHHDRETGQSTYLPTGHTFPDRYSRQRWDEMDKSVAEHGMHEPILLEYNPWTRKMHIGEGHHRLESAARAGHAHVPVWGLKTSQEHAHAKPVPGEPKVRPEHFAGGYFPSSFKPSDVLPPDWVEERQQAPRAQSATACLTCGCDQPHNQHGDKRHITIEDLEDAAEVAGVTVPKAVKNLDHAVGHETGKTASWFGPFLADREPAMVS